MYIMYMNYSLSCLHITCRDTRSWYGLGPLCTYSLLRSGTLPVGTGSYMYLSLIEMVKTLEFLH